MSFNEYPKLMKHPQYAAAVWETLQGKGVGLFTPDTIMRSPERFPDVTVTNLDQERQYAARGYRPNNVANSAEYEQAVLEAKPVDGYAFSEFPKWKYHAFNMPVIAKDAAEEQALGAGWSDTPIISTEDDLEPEEVAPVVNGSAVQHEVVAAAVEPVAKAAQPKKPATKKAAAKKGAAKKPETVDKRTKAYRDAHA